MLLRALFGRRLGLRLVERFAGHRFGQRGRRSSLIDGRLRSLGLELAQDGRQLGDLRLVEFELERQKAKRTANAEAAELVSPTDPAAAVTAVRMTVAMAVTVALSVGRAVWAPWASARPAAGVIRRTLERFAPARVPPRKHTRMHFQSSTPGLIAPGGQFRAEAKWLRAGAGITPRAP